MAHCARTGGLTQEPCYLLVLYKKTQMLSKFQSFIIWYICNYIYNYIILYWILHISPSKMFDITIHISTFLVGSVHPSTGSPSTDPLGAAPPPENTPRRCRRNSAATGRRPSAKSGGLRSEKPFSRLNIIIIIGFKFNWGIMIMIDE